MFKTDAVSRRAWRSAAIAFLCAAAALPAAAGPKVSAEQVQRAVVTVDDPLELQTTLSTERAVRSARGLFRAPHNDNHLRASVDKRTGELRIEVRQTLTYHGPFRRYHSVNYETDGLPATTALRVLEANEVHCQAFDSGLACREELAFEVGEADLRRVAEAAGAARPEPWSFKFKATTGEDHRAHLPRAEILGLLRAVDVYRAGLPSRTVQAAAAGGGHRGAQ